MAAYIPNKSDPDYIRGVDILKRFYDLNKSLYSSKVNYTFDQMLTTLQGRTGQKAFIEGLGFGINASGYTNSTVQSAMRKLAEQARGQIPSKNSDFRNVLIDEGTKVNFVDAVSFVATESAKDVVKGVAKVGDSVIATGQVLSFIMPFLPFIALFILFKIVTDKKVMANLSNLAKLK